MKIIYKQPESERNSLAAFGIQNCYFKKLSHVRDQGSVTRKKHHHTGFEIHMIVEGSQKYEVNGTPYPLESGSFLLICPNVPHAVTETAPDTQKYSLTFQMQPQDGAECFAGKITARMWDTIRFAVDEEKQKKEISPLLIEHCVLELLILVFRHAGMKEAPQAGGCEENSVVAMAKQYIEDNIERSPDVREIAAYCYLSAKQLTRVFRRFEGVSPGEYIKQQRVKRSEKLLADHSLSLKQISDAMNFSSEYYFNAFFKKHAGMPPGEYRKMIGQ